MQQPCCHTPTRSDVVELQAAALAALGRLAVLSEPLCRRAVGLAERRLEGPAGTAADASAEAAVEVTAAAVDAFPNAFGSKLLLIGHLMVPAAAGQSGAAGAEQQDGRQAACEQHSEDAQPDPAEEQAAAGSAPRGAADRLACMAAAAYSRLLLSNKLKLQGVLGPAGLALARSADSEDVVRQGPQSRVAVVVGCALRALLAAAPPRERARLALDLFHQTPLAGGRKLGAAGGAVQQHACSLAAARSDMRAAAN